MTATDELRRLLDERGVEWEGTPGVTFWGNCYALDITTNEKEKVHLHLCCTPEQAIAATLGDGDCETKMDGLRKVWLTESAATLESSRAIERDTVQDIIERHFGKVAVLDDGGPIEWRDDWVCKVGIDYKAIADELNATLGRGTCRNEWERFGKFRCSNCWLQIDSISTNTTQPIDIEFCPKCGKAVKR